MEDTESVSGSGPLTAAEFVEISKDWLLADLVHLVNCGTEGGGIDITIFVSGQIVSGQLIGGPTYFDRYASFFSAHFEDSAEKAKVHEHYSAPGKVYREEGPQDTPSYIHLDDARVYSAAGNPIPANRGLLWRGRLAAIDGFSLGRLIASSKTGV